MRRGLEQLAWGAGPPLLSVVAVLGLLGSRGRIVGLAVAGLVLLVLLALLILVVRMAPRLAVVATIALVALIPIYWTPQVLPMTGTTTAALFLPLGAAAFFAGYRFRWNLVDTLMAVGLAWSTIAYLSNFDEGRGLAAGLLLSSGAPYFAARILSHRRDLSRTVTMALVPVAVLLALLATRERATTVNQFQALKADGYASEVWAVPFTRGGLTRAASSFGQPLLFSLFLAAAVILLVAMPTRGVRGRLFKALTAGIMIFGILATGSRLAFGVAALGSLLVVARRPGRAVLSILSLGLTVAVLAPGLRPLIAGPDAAARDSVDYRSSLLRSLTNTDNWSIAGVLRGSGDADGVVLNYNGSIDSELLLRLLQTGVVGLALFLALFLAVLRRAFRASDGWERGWAMATVAMFFAYGFVAVLLQQGTLFWLGVGITAGLTHRPHQTHRASADADEISREQVIVGAAVVGRGSSTPGRTTNVATIPLSAHRSGPAPVGP